MSLSTVFLSVQMTISFRWHHREVFDPDTIISDFSVNEKSCATYIHCFSSTFLEMDPFNEWLSSTQHVSVQKYASHLTKLGASWDTFLSREPETIANDLVKGGIPLLAAHDIVDVARTAAKQSQAPMAIFWDLENMPIPTTSSGRDVSSRLKSILKPYGDLVQFRGYASIGLNLIPQQKRSDLQLSGCLLVDCPHNGRKEVADKMIIVDAMNFAMENTSGATLCFVTGDVDYAYMLAVLQRYKQYRTIVISRGTLQSMLDVNCDMKMRWETDILQLRSVKPAWSNTADDLGLSVGRDGSNPIESSDDNASESFEPLTADEEWIDDIQFLHNLIRREGASSGGILKSLVGSLLRQTNPARFPNRDSVKDFLAQAIEKGVIWEAGEGGMKQVGLPADETTGMFPAITLSSQLPMPLQSVPERVVAAASTRSYIIFIKWKFCPTGTNLPSCAFIQHKDAWGILLFKKLTNAQRTVSEYPWLRNGFLVDWRKVDKAALLTHANPSVNTIQAHSSTTQDRACTLCQAVRIDVDLLPMGGGFACPECIAWNSMAESEKRDGAMKVVQFLEYLAEHDDIIVPETILRKQLHLRKEYNCGSRKWGALWIKHAVEMGMVVPFKSPNNLKSKFVCLVRKLQEASRPFPPDNFDTTMEENHVLSILWNGKGWMSRLEFIEVLKETFPGMCHPYLRTRVLQNAQQNGRLYIAKGTHSQVVGLSSADAELGLAEMTSDGVPDSDAPECDQPDEENTYQKQGSDSDSSVDDDALRAFLGPGI